MARNDNYNTPWGAADSIKAIAPGIRSVSTSGHGGVLLDEARNALVPAYMAARDGAYEEDCDWCIPALVFEAEWRAHAVATQRDADKEIEAAWRTLRNWHPDSFEKFTGRILKPGESHKRDQQVAENATLNQFVVRSAFGSWQAGVPKGFVGVSATRASDHAHICALVPEAEYDKRIDMPGGLFVVDEKRHTITCPMFQPLQVEETTQSEAEEAAASYLERPRA